MKQALEALEDIGVLTTREWQAVHKNKANKLCQAIAEAEKQEPVGYITNKRQRLNVELKPQTFVEIPTVTDWEIPLFTAPQPKQDEVDIRSRLYQRIHELEEVLKDIAEYTGEGPSTTDWQGIVKLISDSARNALEADPRPYGDASFRYGDHPTSFGLTKRTWVGLTDEEMQECAGESPWTPNGMKCVRAIEAKLKEKNA
jgi:hypothetical protein